MTCKGEFTSVSKVISFLDYKNHRGVQKNVIFSYKRFFLFEELGSEYSEICLRGAGAFSVFIHKFWHPNMTVLATLPSFTALFTYY